MDEDYKKNKIKELHNKELLMCSHLTDNDKAIEYHEAELKRLKAKKLKISAAISNTKRYRNTLVNELKTNLWEYLPQ